MYHCERGDDKTSPARYRQRESQPPARQPSFPAPKPSPAAPLLPGDMLPSGLTRRRLEQHFPCICIPLGLFNSPFLNVLHLRRDEGGGAARGWPLWSPVLASSPGPMDNQEVDTGTAGDHKGPLLPSTPRSPLRR